MAVRVDGRAPVAAETAIDPIFRPIRRGNEKRLRWYKIEGMATGDPAALDPVIRAVPDLIRLPVQVAGRRW